MGHDVIVLGAGLAGLTAARGLAQRGRDMVVWEASDAVGGRVRTDRVDGFLVDRGFQVLNPAYPALRAEVDLQRLDLHPFDRGLAVRRPDGLAIATDPLRRPTSLPATLAGPWANPRQLVALARWLLSSDRPETLAASLDAAGVAGPLRTELLDPFLAGVLLDASGATPAPFVRWMLRFFLRGTPGLPAQGMAALPELLAEPVRARIALDHPVETVERAGQGWRVAGPAGSATARAVLVATDPLTATRLAGSPEVAMRGCLTWWFAADEAPTTSKLIHVHPGGGPVINTAVISNVVPSYAPAGAHLLSAVTLTTASEAEVRTQLAIIYGRRSDPWRLLARQEVPHALPAVPEPRASGAPTAVADGLHVAGDHRAHASIQGALVSGRRAATEILRSPTP